MFGSNYPGQPYLGQGYAGLIGIQFDATANSGYQAASSSYSWTHTVGSGPRQILVVSVGLLSVINSVISLTYNGMALTKLRSDVSVSTTVRTEIWYLSSPTQGSHTVAITLNTASVSGASSTSYNNVSPNNPIDSQNGSTGVTGAGGGSASVSTTTVTAGNWIVDAIAAPTTFTVGSNQVQRANISGAVGNLGQSDKGAIITPASTVMDWDNLAALTSWTMSTVVLKPQSISNMYVSSLTAQISFIGGYLKLIKRPFMSSMSFIGNFVKLINRLISVQLSFTVIFTNLHQHFASFTASLNFTGVFLKKLLRLLTASLTFVGVFKKFINRLVNSQLSFTGGALYKLIKYPFTASINLIGSFTKTGKKVLTASLNLLVNINKRRYKILTASLNLLGILTKVLSHSFTASISFVGSFISAIIKAFNKILNPTKWSTPTGNEASKPTVWSKDAKNLTQWRPIIGKGFVNMSGSLAIVNKIGLMIVNVAKLIMVENPTFVATQNNTSWIKTGKIPVQWRPNSGVGSVNQTSSLQIVNSARLLIVNSAGLIIIENPTYVKPKNITSWNPSGM